MNICQILPHVQFFTIEGFGKFMESMSCQNSKFFAISFSR